MDDVAYQYFVLSNLGLNVKVIIVYLNNETYTRGKELDINQLFNKEDMTHIAQEKQVEVKRNINRVNNVMEVYNSDKEPETDIGPYCLDKKRFNRCVFWEYCIRDLPKPNVFDIANMGNDKKFKKYYESKITFKDLENDKDITTDRFVQQIDFELHNKEPAIDKEEIKEILDNLKYPLYFMDYESLQYAIPQLEKTKAYQQIPFQYSLHIIKEEGAPIEHKEFLADIDDENMIRTFAESMINNMPEDGSVIVYNKGFESHVNTEIGEMYDDLKEKMERINSNIVDFMAPFQKRQYYTKEMEGSYSIKKVLPALFPNDPELNYDNLPLVHNGVEAPIEFMGLKDKSPKKQEESRQGLLKYCELDTYAMVKIWEKFKEVTIDD